MEPFRRWADLPPDLLCRTGDLLELKWYASARGACTPWRSALVPPSPALLVAADGDRWCPYAASLPTRRSFELTAVASGSRCVGSSNGWLALSVDDGDETVFVLLNPVAAVEIILPPLIYEHEYESRCDWVSKVVFAPCPAKDDFAAAAICDVDRVAYVTAGAKRWAVMDPVRLRPTREIGDQLTDLVYTDEGKVYCLSKCGDVHVLRLPERRRREPANAEDDAGPSEPEFSVLYPPSPPSPLSPPPPYEYEEVSPEHEEALEEYDEEPSGIMMALPSFKYEEVARAALGPHLNAPATVEPLLPVFDPATVFAPPYDTVSAFTGDKNLVFCKGNLYQVWRNTSCTVTLQLPAGGQRRVAENEILVLRYYRRRRRQPCWDAVKDLGGYSLFVGRNNAVSMYAEGVPGLRGNCVYWIGGHGRDQGMVFDMESGRSKPCGAPKASALPGGHPYSTICWYFMSDVMSIRHQQQLQQ